ncbi:MAG: helix-turn-helix domain-containing protein [Prevotella sp.]|jgi:AraC-like DNA-binding protein
MNLKKKPHSQLTRSPQRWMTILRTLLLLWLSSTVLSGFAALQPAFYNHLQTLPTDKLIEKAIYYVGETDKADSALACYTIATSRYHSHMNTEELRLMVRAFSGKWYVYLFNFFNYTKAYECLTTLEEISNKLPEIRPRLYNNYGIFYQTLAEQGDDIRQDSLALSYYRKAFWLTKYSDGNTLDLIFTNLVSVSERTGMIGSLSKEWLRYKQLPLSKDNHYRQYNHRLYEGYLLMAQQKWVDAERVFELQLRELPNEQSEMRYHYSAIVNIAHARAAQGRYRVAAESLQTALKIAKSGGFKDAELEAYKLMMEYFTAVKDYSKADSCRYNYLCLKDTLLNYQKLTSVNELRFLNQMRKFDDQIQENEHKRQMQQTLMLIAFGVAIIVCVFLVIVWRKNRKLKLSNTNLYNKTVAMLRAEEEARKRHEELERQLAERSTVQTEKYKTSHLAEGNKGELIERIQDVMENNEEIYTAGFSCDRLAQLVGSNYKYVSQVINETRNCNFSAFLNEYRIKEACKRISDTQHYGNLTIEAISNSVGIKSRSTFIAAFKRFTGLTPSEYLKIARTK